MLQGVLAGWVSLSKWALALAGFLVLVVWIGNTGLDVFPEWLGRSVAVAVLLAIPVYCAAQGDTPKERIWLFFVPFFAIGFALGLALWWSALTFWA